MGQPARKIFEDSTQCVRATPQEVVILLSDGATLSDCSAITQPLMEANRLSGRQLYRWRYASLTEPVQRFACGAMLACTTEIGALHRDALVFLNWANPDKEEEQVLVDWLRKQHRFGTRLVSLGNSAFTLARAGLLEGEPVAVHWEWLSLMQELHPQVEAVDHLYTLAPRICASSCSDAATELVVGLIEERHGADLARQVQERLNRPHCRPPTTPQSVPLARRYGSRNQTFLAVIERIERCFDKDLTVQDLCIEFNISRRQLERQFAEKTGTSPLRFIKEYRLRKAQQLLQSTDMSVLDVALASGFPSAACFRSAFKRKFGMTPSRYG